MSYTKRNYRTNLAMQGLTYLDGIEVECTVMDLSTTGARLEISPGKSFSSVVPFAQTITNNSIIDVRINEMHMDGEVKVIRKEIKKGLLYLSIVFDNVFFGLENVPYKRKVYRKKFSSFGHMILNDLSYEVICTNFSVKGIMLVVFDKLSVDQDELLQLDFNHIGVHGSAKVIWIKQTKKNHTYIGAEYIQLNDSVKGIATFSPQ